MVCEDCRASIEAITRYDMLRKENECHIRRETYSPQVGTARVEETNVMLSVSTSACQPNRIAQLCCLEHVAEDKMGDIQNLAGISLIAVHSAQLVRYWATQHL